MIHFDAHTDTYKPALDGMLYVFGEGGGRGGRREEGREQEAESRGRRKVGGEMKRTLSFGGDHLVSLPLLQAYNQHFQRPVAMIHFDAHTDTYKPAVDGML
jgi:agmatinase